MYDNSNVFSFWWAVFIGLAALLWSILHFPTTGVCFYITVVTVCHFEHLPASRLTLTVFLWRLCALSSSLWLSVLFFWVNPGLWLLHPPDECSNRSAPSPAPSQQLYKHVSLEIRHLQWNVGFCLNINCFFSWRLLMRYLIGEVHWWLFLLISVFTTIV